MKRRLHITLTYELFNWIKAEANANGISVSGFITYSLNQKRKKEEEDAAWGLKLPSKRIPK